MVKMFKKVFITALGLMMIGVGIGGLIFAGLGVDPPSVFQDGLSIFFNVSFGQAAAVMNAVVIAGLFIIDRKYVHIASIMAIFLIGFTADYAMQFIQIFFTGEVSIVVKGIFMIVGWALVALGIPLYISAGLGVSATDAFSEVITDKITHSYRVTRIAFDVAFVGIGFLLGGAVGIGTIIAAFGTGPLIAFYRPRVNKIIKPWIGDEVESEEVIPEMAN